MTHNRTARFFLDMPREVMLAWAKSQLAQAAAHPLCWNCRAEMLSQDGECPVCGKNQNPFTEPDDGGD